jgi:endonuclease/exonuclease/phosphatase family metal-dependent hydrolase
MTYNILDGGRGREDLIVDVLHAASPDVVVLEEVFDEALLQEVAARLDMRYYLARGNSRYRLGLLSRWPIADTCSYHPFPPIQQSVLEASIDHPNRRLYVFGVHLAARPFVLLELWRWWEARLILRRVARHAGSACLIVGDFNATAPGDRPEIKRLGFLNRLMIFVQGGLIYRFAIRAVLRSGMVDCYRAMNPHVNGFTYGPPNPIGRIDYIFASPEMVPTLTACSVAREPAAVDRASDHYPVIADFTMRRQTSIGLVE